MGFLFILTRKNSDPWHEALENFEEELKARRKRRMNEYYTADKRSNFNPKTKLFLSLLLFFLELRKREIADGRGWVMHFHFFKFFKILKIFFQHE